jgi:hypothetical protein
VSVRRIPSAEYIALDTMSLLSTPELGGGPEPSPSLSGPSLSSQISSGGGVGGGGGVEGHDATGPSEVPLPAVGARVRCTSLLGSAELNGCLGRVESHEGVRARMVMDGPGGRGLHSSSIQLNLSALYGIGGRARRDCVARVKGVSGGVQGV